MARRLRPAARPGRARSRRLGLDERRARAHAPALARGCAGRRRSVDGRGARAARRVGPRRPLVARPHGPHRGAARRADDARLARLVRHEPGRRSTRAGCCARTSCCAATRSATSARSRATITKRPGDADVAQRDRRTTRDEPNENYARELQELFTLGAGRGYGERDVREMARALTGWRADWRDGVGMTNFRFDREFHDGGRKRIYGRRGRYDWRDAADLAVGHRLHPSFFVTKLWSYFIPTPPPPGTRRALERLYPRSDHDVRPVVAAILRHPALHDRPADGQAAGRSTSPGCCARCSRGIDTDAWAWLIGDERPDAVRAAERGRLGRHALDRHRDVARPLDGGELRARGPHARPRPGEDEATRRSRSRARPRRSTPRTRFWGRPTLTRATRAELVGFAQRAARSPHRAVAAGVLRDPAPERAADADRHLPRPAHELMAHHCRDYARTAQLRAPPAPACPRSSPGMPAPAGTGLSRRSFLLRSAGLALSVYGAGRLAPLRGRGGARAGRRRAGR